MTQEEIIITSNPLPQRIKTPKTAIVVPEQFIRKRKPRRRRGKNPTTTQIANRIIEEASLVRLPPMSIKQSSRKVLLKSKLGKLLTQEGFEWLCSYIMPTEENLPKMAAAIPDNALPQSANAAFQFADTLQTPFQNAGSTVIGSLNYSRTDILLPLNRLMKIIIVCPTGEAHGDAVMTIVASMLNGLTDTLDLFYPKWLGSSETVTIQTSPEPSILPRVYITALDTVPLRGIATPSSIGQSTFATGFRFCSYGTRVTFNTPDLLNQGTFCAGQFAVNSTQRTLSVSGSRAAIDLKSLWNGGAGAGLGQNFITSSNSDVLPTANFQSPGNSTTFTSTHQVFTPSGQLLIDVTDEWQYQGNPVDPTTGIRTTIIQNLTTPANSYTINSSILNTNTSSTSRLYYVEPVGEPESTVGDIDCILIDLPMATQGNLKQQDRRAPVLLMKEGGGYEMSVRTQNTVFNTNQAGSFKNIKFTGPNTTEEDIINSGTGGIYDILDLNFSVGICAMMGLSWAAALYDETDRGVQYVPVRNSIVGAFVQSNTVTDRLAIDIAMELDNNLAHAVPANQNFKGTVLNACLSAVSALAQTARSGISLANAMKNACSTVMDKADSYLSPRRTNVLANIYGC